MEYKLASLRERYEVWEDEENLTLNKNALKKWREEMSILEDRHFEKMLNNLKYDAIIFSNAVSKDISDRIKDKYTKKVKNSDWYKIYEEIMEEKENPEIMEGIKENYSACTYDFIVFFVEKLEETMGKVKNIDLSEDFLVKSFEGYIAHLMDLTLKAQIVDLNDNKIQLKSEDSEERLKEYFRGFSKSKRRIEFLNKYPLLKYYLTIHTSLFLKYIIEIIQNVDKDVFEMREVFARNLIELTDIVADKGDSHSGNKSVVILEFDNKDRIVYKPKNLMIVESYNNFINWLNEDSSILSLKTFKILPKEEYSYEEFVKAESCKNEEEVREYYEKLGQLTGVIFYLNGNDIHMENLMAVGSDPILVDIETLLQSPRRYVDEVKDTINYHFRSLDRTLILPGVYIGKKDKIDLSAISGGLKEESMEVFSPVDLNNDNVRFDMVPFHHEVGKNTPFQEGEEVNYWLYKEDFIRGFKNISKLFVEKKLEIKALLSQCFKDKYIRVIFKNTNEYFRIINSCYHPDLLTDFLDLEKVLENMWMDFYKESSIIESEIEDMRHGDVPLFMQSASRGTVYDSQKVKREFETDISIAPLEYLMETIEDIDEKSIARNIDIINYSMGNYVERKREYFIHLYFEEVPIRKLGKKKVEKDYEDYIIDIYQKINDSKLVIDKEDFWEKVSEVKDGIYKVSIGDNGLYNDTAGVLLFLLTYEKLISKSSIEIKTITNKLAERLIIREENGFSGSTGLAYALYLMNEISGDLYYRDKYVNVRNDCNKQIVEKLGKRHFHTDYLNGLTSYLTVLLKGEEILDSENFFTINKIIEYIKKEFAIDKSEVGLAHGVTGLTSLWHQVAKFTNDKSDKQFLQELEKVEEEELKLEALNNHWCRGNTGVAFSMLKRYELTQNNKYLEKFDEVFQNIIEQSMMRGDMYCHGNISVVDLCLEAYTVLKDEKFYRIAKIIADNMLYNFDKNHEYFLYHENLIADLSLFTGLSGIGYVLCRLLFVDKIPTLTIL